MHLIHLKLTERETYLIYLFNNLTNSIPTSAAASSNSVPCRLHLGPELPPLRSIGKRRSLHSLTSL